MGETGQIANKTQKAFDVFVSHSSKNGEEARLIVETLEAANVRCWIAPRNILPGSQYGESIVEGIESSELMILVFSQHANTSPQITREVERAVHHGMRIIPFRIENIPPSKNLEYFISSPHWLDAYTGSFDSHLSYLKKTVLHLLGRGKPDETPTRSGAYVLPQGSNQILPSLISLTKGLSSLGLIGGKNLFSVVGNIATKLATFVNAVLTMLGHAAEGLVALVPVVGRGALALAKQWKALLLLVLIFGASYLSYKWVTLKPLDESLIGRWQMSIPGLPLVAIPEIHSNGDYSLTLAYQESGNAEIRNGWLYLVSKNGYERRVNWEPADEKTVNASLIPDEFWNLAAKISPDKTDELSVLRNKSTRWILDAGDRAPETRRWSIVPEENDLPWTFLFETGPGTAYKIRAVQVDKGRAGTEGTILNLNSSKLGIISGEYKIPDQDSATFATQFGLTNWRRLSK